MKILIVGNGSREHSIGQSIAKNKNVEKIYFAPGNGGTQEIGENISLGVNDISNLVDFAKQVGIDYTIVGPEEPLVHGIGDVFEEEGLKIFAPSKEAARLEGSKAYAKEFCVRHNIPTADYLESESEDTIRQKALNLLEDNGVAVLKADGLAAGKGVKIVYSEKEIESFLQEVFQEGKFDSEKVVVEEFLDGFEMSLLAFVDGKTIRPLATAKDHKTIFEGGKGSNTGGMGTYSPNIEAEPFLEEIEEIVLKPFLKALQEDEIDYRGLVFIGLMIGNRGISVLEFNVRFGDPETQSVLQRLDTDLLDLMMATSEGRLEEVEVKNNDKKVVSVVLASGGYPESSEKGVEIKNLDKAKEVMIFHAGTKEEEGKILTNGGRVLTVTAVGDTFQEAMEKAYKGADEIEFNNKQIRRDIGPKVSRVYVTRKEGFDEAEKSLKKKIEEELGLTLEGLKHYLRYDLEGLTEDEVERLSREVLSEAPSDFVYFGEEALKVQANFENPLVIQYLPGQYVQRNAGVLDTANAIFGHEHLKSHTADVYSFTGNLDREDVEKIEKYLVNPVDQMKGEVYGVPTTLEEEIVRNLENPTIEGFISLSEEELSSLLEDRGLAMSLEDLAFIQDHFKGLGRDINETELAILDTYWSDHCRHTTFLTELDIKVEEKVAPYIQEAFQRYLDTRKELNRTKPISLMDLGTIVAKYLKTKGIKTNIEESEEINACSIHIDVESEDPVTGKTESIPYLLMFKNETHNHPTEIEPYGGASTCLGGCIRDPLSGRAFVYQAMRVTGSGDPRQKVEDTLESKLPQRKITTEAANGYSAYGNQIGLPAGLIHEIYHNDYVAKRMEIGAVVGAAPTDWVTRAVPAPGDLILLLGGRTGRDGVGGATGSSKEHDAKSLFTASAEVQKGNAPMERKLVRLFRTEEVSKKIKRCNDFGAGGVSVAIGELADGLMIHLDRVPLKYEGLTPKEIAISESQERMAVVIDKKDLAFFQKACEEENVECTQVAEVTEEPTMKMVYGDTVIAELSREFIDTSGVSRHQKVEMVEGNIPRFMGRFNEYGLKDLEKRMTDLEVLSQKNLVEKFDQSVGKGTVLSPMGGKNQVTPTQAMVATVPVVDRRSKTASAMSFGGNPDLLKESPYLGGYYAVIESVAKLVATGAKPADMYLTFQEYFEKLGEDPNRWSKPLEALLGAFDSTMDLEIPPIGGKDSMSGTFRDLDVPPTLISFAIAPMNVEHVVSNVLQKAGNKLGYIQPKMVEEKVDLKDFLEKANRLTDEIAKGNVKSAIAITHLGSLPHLLISAEGNGLGFDVKLEDLYNAKYGAFLVEYVEDFAEVEEIGVVTEKEIKVNGESISYDGISQKWREGLNEIFPPEIGKASEEKIAVNKTISRPRVSSKAVAVPKVTIAVFPGTNSEWDTAESFRRAGAETDVFVFRNQTAEENLQSIETLAEKIKDSQIFAIPGGFSFSDEPDGSAKFIANVLRTEKMKEAIDVLLKDNDGLMLGICNGFQALVKSGYLPNGVAEPQKEDSPTLTFNDNHRHVARLVTTKSISNDSPWLQKVELGKEYRVPISHGEGRFVINEEKAKELIENNQIAFTYVDNPNGSTLDIEGIVSPDGKILGKMGHVERADENLFINIPDVEIIPVIESGVAYMKGEEK
ncbi:phosphoribosylformylglycinamidine synthase [Peptoniphilus sp. KCTC 25270]|uniref:phosphoribosylformylglycinamidine synthase n=1 Tax=Peptoniphilus sp. KCTC 25270 TaxID=2897414 RepID=UPI001E29143A|nr:phosphoribosylformylglycinamidine synthase [Peptoniphilus sp. KCTC 25270]MCD1146656.1 phosphoribosylformylglycinamidine synthase [Peptoniphilus sp. KCTC 25270]